MAWCARRGHAPIPTDAPSGLAERVTTGAPETMQPTPTHPEPALLVLLGLLLAGEALLQLLAAAVALVLTLAGWCPPTRSAYQRPSTPPPAPDLTGCSVRELRRLARAAGLPSQLRCRGRRAELLAALA